ncbi:MAG: outer membrane protein transport protein [Chlamydiales bacterium]
MGNAYAGVAATGEDASTIFFNPAGLTRLCGNEAICALHAIFPVGNFKDRGTILYPPIAEAAGVGLPILGGSPGNGGEIAGIGNLYVSKKCNDRFAVGLGINTPFGSATDYHPNWVGRYHAIRSELLTININPCVAFKIHPCLSVGIGFDVMYFSTTLTNKIDYGSIAWNASLDLPEPQRTAIQNGLTALGFLPQTQDGRVRLEGKDWSYGWNIGVLWEPCETTRVGFHYRSGFRHNVRGSEKFRDLPTLIQNPSLGGALAPFFGSIQASVATPTNARATIDLPLLLSLSAYHEIGPCWAIMGDVTWTKWDVIDVLEVLFDNPAQPPSTTTVNWENTFRYAFGANYRPNCCWVFRTGAAWDVSPVPSKELYTPRFIDNDRFWLTGGFGYSFSACFHVDVGYAHLFVKEPRVDKTGFHLEEDIIRGGLKGVYRAHTDIVSAQIVYNF